MGVVFQEWKDGGVGPALMDCSASRGRQLVRLTNFISQEYQLPSAFFLNGEIMNDFIYIEVPKLQSLFQAVTKSQNRLFLTWAEYAAGMLEIATQTLMNDAWPDARDKFLPRHHGVEVEDIPKSKPNE